jgi:hypothetical protein
VPLPETGPERALVPQIGLPVGDGMSRSCNSCAIWRIGLSSACAAKIARTMLVFGDHALDLDP